MTPSLRGHPRYSHVCNIQDNPSRHLSPINQTAKPIYVDRMSNPQYIFSGSSTIRPVINLGGLARNTGDGNTQADLILRAKKEREERELGRLKQKACIKIQVGVPSLSPKARDMLIWAVNRIGLLQRQTISFRDASDQSRSVRCHSTLHSHCCNHAGIIFSA